MAKRNKKNLPLLSRKLLSYKTARYKVFSKPQTYTKQSLMLQSFVFEPNCVRLQLVNVFGSKVNVLKGFE